MMLRMFVKFLEISRNIFPLEHGFLLTKKLVIEGYMINASRLVLIMHSHDPRSSTSEFNPS